jgi:D-alanyl-D-alanine carboxypeptidase/D-alanyl-D-alanine-endopeptidase (penicillin-binding protein 4)
MLALGASLGAQNSTTAVPAPPALTAAERVQSQRFEARVQALIAGAPANKAEWGLLVVDAATGAVLFEQNADKYFVPASNLKLFSTAIALAKLGPDYRFHTTLETRGTISDKGVLAGDLLLVGRGDPNLSNRKFPYDSKEEFDGNPDQALAELVDGLVAKGVKEIAGDVIGDDSYFPQERYPGGWEIDDMVWEYGAPISALSIEDNTVTLTLTPGEHAGDAVGALVDPPTADFAVQNDVTTSAVGAKPDLTLTREPGADIVTVFGSLPAHSTPRKLTLAIEEPAQHAAVLLSRLLVERGIQIDGSARVRHVPETLTTPRTVLAEHVSIPLAEEVKLVNKISQNLHAELLLRAAARQAGPWTDTDDVMKFAADFYTAAGIAPGDVIQSDGSGLSRRDLVTPRAIVTLLSYAQRQSWFAPYLASLPLMGVDGTLEDRMKNTPEAGRIHAKTGSVEHVRTISGFADLGNGRRAIFSFLSNNGDTSNRTVAKTLDGFCAAMIEEFGGATAPAAPAGASADGGKGALVP